MRFEKNIFRCGRLGFTLIELLVVIGIIAILAGMVLAGVMSVKRKGSIVKTKYEAGTIAAAITQFTADYGLPPVSKSVWDCSGRNSSKDFSYGTNTSGTADSLTGSYGAPVYRTNNSEVIAVLRNSGPTVALNNLAQSLNPKKKTYIDAPLAINAFSGGVGPDGVFRDPWGLPYIISVDLDSSGTTTDGFYARLISSKVPASANYPKEIAGSVLVWSFGPDGEADANPTVTGLTDPSQILKAGKNRDNVLSWGQ